MVFFATKFTLGSFRKHDSVSNGNVKRTIDSVRKTT